MIQLKLPSEDIQDAVLKGEILLKKDRLAEFCRNKGIKLHKIAFCPYDKEFHLMFQHCVDKEIFTTEGIRLEDVDDLLSNKDELGVRFNNYIVNQLEKCHHAVATARNIMNAIGAIAVEDREITPEEFNKGEISAELLKNKKAVVAGMEEDAPVVTNDKGGKQSKVPHAFHLFDPEVARDLFEQYGVETEKNKYYEAFAMGFDYMAERDYNPCGSKQILLNMIEQIEDSPSDVFSAIAQRLAYGQTRKYPPNNWRLIPREEHLNHAMNHLFALSLGDTQDDHKSAALCRLHMALATMESENFKYQEYVPQEEVKVELDERLFRTDEEIQEITAKRNQQGQKVDKT